MIDVANVKLVTLGAVASLLSVRVRTVREWIAVRHVPVLETVKFGGRVYTSLQALQRFGQQRDGTRSPSGTVPVARQSNYDDAIRNLQAKHGLGNGKAKSHQRQEVPVLQ